MMAPKKKIAKTSAHNNDAQRKPIIHAGRTDCDAATDK